MQLRLHERNHRIRQNQKIRPAPLPLHHIARIRLPRIKLRPRRRRQMPARRKSPHPHMIHRNSPLRRMRPHHPNRPLRILQLNRMVILRPQPVLQHKRRHPALIQPPRKLIPLLLRRQMRITAPRRHHHPRLRRIRRHRQKHRQRRLIVILIPQRPRSAPGHNSIVFPAPPCETAEAVDGAAAATGAATCPNPTPPTTITNATPNRTLLTKPPRSQSPTEVIVTTPPSSHPADAAFSNVP